MSIEDLKKKWQAVLEHSELPKIGDHTRKGVVAQLLENTEVAIKNGDITSQNGLLAEAAPTNSVSAGGVQNYDPVLVSLVRRSMPNLVSYDIMGVQPMTGPTGLVFAMRSKYTSPAGTEAFYNEAQTDFSGAGTQAGTTGTAATANTGTSMTTAAAEALGDSANNAFPEMAFEIEKVSVTAGSRALKAEYTTEMAQDLKAIHGLDAEKELSNILTAEILADINREAVRTVYNTAKAGSQTGVAVAGTFDLDVDANGRWLVEKFKGLMFQIEREANQIAKETRRGRGNIILCSSNVASALTMAGVLDYTPALKDSLNVDDTGNTFAGTINGRYKVYVDPYAGGEYMVVGYKGASSFDAGLFYCPYVPLQFVRAMGENTFQPKIGFKTRYGLVANPFAEGAVKGAGALTPNSNVYYRRSLISNLI
jgi:hypothetical protein